jgi:hypothetical protein
MSTALDPIKRPATPGRVTRRAKVIPIENVPEFATWGAAGSNGRPPASRRGEVVCAWRATLEILSHRANAGPTPPKRSTLKRNKNNRQAPGTTTKGKDKPPRIIKLLNHHKFGAANLVMGEDDSIGH